MLKRFFELQNVKGERLIYSVALAASYAPVAQQEGTITLTKIDYFFLLLAKHIRSQTL